MKETTRVLAFDYGASSGRAILCSYQEGRLSLQEVHRFDNEPVEKDGTLFWNLEDLYQNLLTGLEKARDAGGFDSVGVDTWGVDFGLLGADGALLEAPVHYRDGRTNGLSDEVCGRIGEEALYERTGSQRMDINTLYQLYSLQKSRPEFLGKAACLLPIPNLFEYLLTGEKHAEWTEASTTQMLNLETKEWNFPLLEELGLPVSLLPKLVRPGTVTGRLKDELCARLGVPAVPVVSVATHDTASAVLAAPAEEEEFLFISCGTWSLFGTELAGPLINERARLYNLSNELGYGGKVIFLKNIIGLWLIQETRRQFRREGKEYSYADMERLARSCEPFACFIDPDAPEFVPPGDIPGRIRAFCERTGQRVPRSDGEIVRCIYESLALEYRYVFEQLKACAEKEYRRIYLLGGGAKDPFLCQMTADATGVPVTAGPVEATALGNAAAQLEALGCFDGPGEARAAVRRSFAPAEYPPEDAKAWDEPYERFLKILNP